MNAPAFLKISDGAKFALRLNMLLAATFLMIGTFVGLVLRRLKNDIQQEKAFRSQLNRSGPALGQSRPESLQNILYSGT